MPDFVRILAVEKDSDEGVFVTFSDGTTAGYVVEELLGLRPKRKWARSQVPSKALIQPNPNKSVWRVLQVSL